jgi:hypothetical protein
MDAHATACVLWLVRLPRCEYDAHVFARWCSLLFLPLVTVEVFEQRWRRKRSSWSRSHRSRWVAPSLLADIEVEAVESRDEVDADYADVTLVVATCENKSIKTRTAIKVGILH